MSEDPQHHEVNLNVAFTPAPPRPRRRHRFLDICAILFAAALIAVAVGDSSVVFAIVAAVGILLYVIGDTTAFRGVR